VIALLWMFRREWIRFIRRASQVVSTVATPAVIWVLFSAGFSGAMEGSGYATHLGPGMAILVVLFAGVFTGMSLIEDRHMGFLQGVLVSPAPRWSIALGKLGAAALIAAAQGLPLLIATAVLAGSGSPLSLVLAAGGLLLTAVGVGGFALALAWWIDSPRGFHALLTTLIMPLWVLSGAVFPSRTASGWLVFIERVNPVAWCRVTVDGAMRGQLAEALPAAAGCVLFALGGVIAAALTLGNAPRATEDSN
jgi:ABC-type multidrug transport system permease subunit